MNGDGEVFHLSKILEGLKLNFSQFQQMCIAAGYGYLKNWKGIGIHRAYEMVAVGGNVLDALARKGADEEYCEKFKKALAVFKHQTVFDFESGSTVPVEKWGSDPSMDIQHLCRLYPRFSFLCK